MTINGKQIINDAIGAAEKLGMAGLHAIDLRLLGCRQGATLGRELHLLARREGQNGSRRQIYISCFHFNTYQIISKFPHCETLLERDLDAARDGTDGRVARRGGVCVVLARVETFAIAPESHIVGSEVDADSLKERLS